MSSEIGSTDYFIEKIYIFCRKKKQCFLFKKHPENLVVFEKETLFFAFMVRECDFFDPWIGG